MAPLPIQSSGLLKRQVWFGSTRASEGLKADSICKEGLADVATAEVEFRGEVGTGKRTAIVKKRLHASQSNLVALSALATALVFLCLKVLLYGTSKHIHRGIAPAAPKQTVKHNQSLLDVLLLQKL